MRFTTGERMARIDQTTIDDYKISNEALMETAGQLTARHIRTHLLSDHNSQRIVILCGKGHNGADGLVAARWLDKWGYRVCVLMATGEQQCSKLTQQQAVSLHREQTVEFKTYKSGDTLPGADLYVDALLGTGLNGDPREPFAEIIDRLNRRHQPVAAIDIPSGLGGDYHLPYKPCVKADLTVTMGLPKIGMLLEPGYTNAGMVIVQELGFPESVYDDKAGPCHLITGFEMKNYLPGRQLTDHKGNAGRLAVLAGSKMYPGAAFLAGSAAADSGAGLVSIIGPENLSRNQTPGERDLIFPYNQDELLNMPEEDEKFRSFCRKQNAFIIGPGLGQSENIKKTIKKLLPRLNKPAVIDADGLNIFADDPRQLKKCTNTILTPHPGEAARLLSRSLNTILKKPVESVRKIAELTGQTVILKTSRPIVAHPNDTYSINVTGTPALSKAGSGDVLTGIIGALLAQGLETGPAACLGLYLHGAAGRKAAEQKNIITVRSEDLIDNISGSINELATGGQPPWFPLKFEGHSTHTLLWNPFPI